MYIQNEYTKILLDIPCSGCNSGQEATLSALNRELRLAVKTKKARAMMPLLLVDADIVLVLLHSPPDKLTAAIIIIIRYNWFFSLS